MGEHLPCKQGVMSSNLTISTLAMSNAGFGAGTDRARLLAKDRGRDEDDSAKHVTKQTKVCESQHCEDSCLHNLIFPVAMRLGDTPVLIPNTMVKT